MEVSIQEAEVSIDTYLVFLAVFELPCLQMKEELHWCFIQAATGIKMLKLFPSGTQMGSKNPEALPA